MGGESTRSGNVARKVAIRSKSAGVASLVGIVLRCSTSRLWEYEEKCGQSTQEAQGPHQRPRTDSVHARADQRANSTQHSRVARSASRKRCRAAFRAAVRGVCHASYDHNGVCVSQFTRQDDSARQSARQSASCSATVLRAGKSAPRRTLSASVQLPGTAVWSLVSYLVIDHGEGGGPSITSQLVRAPQLRTMKTYDVRQSTEGVTQTAECERQCKRDSS